MKPRLGMCVDAGTVEPSTEREKGRDGDWFGANEDFQIWRCQVWESYIAFRFYICEAVCEGGVVAGVMDLMEM